MKAMPKIAALGTFVFLAMSTASHAESHSAKPQSDQRRCFAYPKSQTLQWRISPNETVQKMIWTTNCTSPFSASVGGNSRLSAYLQKLEDGRWITIDSGLSLSANVGPGTYRVFVVNESGMPGLYTFTWRKALG